MIVLFLFLFFYKSALPSRAMLTIPCAVCCSVFFLLCFCNL